MAKWLVKIGFDHGGPEDGPIVHCSEELIEADSKEDAENKIDNKYGYGRDESYCGCSVELATEDQIKKYEDKMREAQEEYDALVEAGIIDPKADEDMWKQYEEDEKRRDHLFELADQVEGFNKWKITHDDEVLIDTADMTDDQILEYMRSNL